MRILVFSDVHGNLPALEGMLRSERVDAYINLGDVVNYGPWSNECVELIRNLKNCYNIKGNHEEYFINNFCDVPNKLVVDFFNQCVVDFKYVDVISKYHRELLYNDFRLIHTLNNKDYIFNDSNVMIEQNTMLGHSHQQYIRTVNNHVLLNPGSAGQNRKFINMSDYVIWNLDTNQFQFKQLKYDFDYLVSEMKRRNYPAACIDYYTRKQRF
jgi:putative phosphoesterase